ncbi:MAG: c-type cytochrome [Phycisphaerae bacterium]
MRSFGNRWAFGRCGLLGLLLFGFAGFGCGTDFNNVLFQSLSSAGRSAFDLTLTDLANSVANVANSLNTPASDADQGEGGASGDGDNDSDGDGDSGGATDGGAPPDGDATNGRAVFDANGCSTCHCDDAGGGCALGAPSLQGVEAQEVTDKLTGVVGHTGGTRELTDAELADLATYLAELAGGGSTPEGTPDQGATGDPDAGQVLFDANGCSTCHCDDAGGGCAQGAPSLQGVEAQEVTDKLTGVVMHSGGTRDLNETELGDLAAYLADLAGGGASNVDPDVGSGRVLYESNGCGSCHCPDGAGGCAADAPAITGATTTVLDEFLRGVTTHTGGKQDLSDGGIESLAAFLAGG